MWNEYMEWCRNDLLLAPRRTPLERSKTPLFARKTADRVFYQESYQES